MTKSPHRPLEERQANVIRLRKIIGQLNGVEKMLNQERDCSAMLTQLVSARRGGNRRGWEGVSWRTLISVTSIKSSTLRRRDCDALNWLGNSCSSAYRYRQSRVLKKHVAHSPDLDVRIPAAFGQSGHPSPRGPSPPICTLGFCRLPRARRTKSYRFCFHVDTQAFLMI